MEPITTATSSPTTLKASDSTYTPTKIITMDPGKTTKPVGMESFITFKESCAKESGLKMYSTATERSIGLMEQCFKGCLKKE